MQELLKDSDREIATASDPEEALSLVRSRPFDLVISEYALHHLPDFWKAVALERMAGFLRPGGTLRLRDLVRGRPGGLDEE